MSNWKLEKIKSIDDEVRELHPLLRELFHRIPDITHVNYCQGNQEYGADFVLTKRDPILLSDEYVGVIVKTQSIKQNHDDVRRQIRECEIERPVEGGKKAVHLSEIWVLTSKDITKNAQETLHYEYKTTKLKFIDSDLLLQLLNRHYPQYFEFATAERTKFISMQLEKIGLLGKTHRLAPVEVDDAHVAREIQRVTTQSKRKFLTSASKPSKLLDEIVKRKAIFLEGGMGSGKSELIRSTAHHLCDDKVIEELKLIPYLTTYREIRNNPDFSIVELVADLRTKLNDKDKTIVIFIDGLDETPEENNEKIDLSCKMANDLLAFDDVKIVVSSRVIDELTLTEKLERSFERFVICPLSYGVLVSLIERVCSGVKLTSKFLSDLQRSSLMKSLPRTPLSAILLGKLLAENVTELPSTLPELYSKYTELVLGRWDLEKGKGSEKEYDTIYRLTCILANYMFEHDAESISLAQLRDMFKEYLAERRTGQDAPTLLAAFLKRTEIISFDSDQEIVRFRHRTFAEFFYAQGLFQKKGHGFEIRQPFHPYWHGVEYFYLGALRDAPDRINTLVAYVPPDEIQRFVKLSHFGALLMAAYQTPYRAIQSAVYRSFAEAADEYVRIVDKSRESWFSRLPEVQVLAVFTATVKEAYQYEFFQPALVEAKLQAELDSGLGELNQQVMVFLIDAVLAELGDKSAFISLAENDSALNWTLRLGIKFAGNDAKLVNDATKRMEKKLGKSTKGNPQLINYLQTLQYEPLVDRKDIKKPT